VNIVEKVAVGGLADMLSVRLALAHLDRADQDAAISSARRRGELTGQAREGRYGVSPEQREAEMDDGIALLALREE
jgi:hypothetical protein